MRAAAGVLPRAQLRVGCVGLGRMGRIRVDAIMGHPAAQLAWVVDGDAAVARDVGERYGARHGDSLDAMLSDGSVDAVWIACPTDAHEAVIKAAVAAGKAVGVEKPVCGSAAAAMSCYAAAARAEVPLFCSFQRRFDPAYVAVAAAAARGDLGVVKRVHTVFRDSPCPPIEFLRRGGDPFHDLLVHDLDYVLGEVLRARRWSDLPTRVTATGTSFTPELRAEGIMDTATLLLEFASGVVVTMEADRFAAYGYDQRCEVFGTKGMAQVTNPARTAAVTATDAGVRGDLLQHSFPQRFAETYRTEMDAFFRTAVGDAEPRVTSDDVLYSSVVAEAGRLSAVHGTPVAMLPGAASGAVTFVDPAGRALGEVPVRCA